MEDIVLLQEEDEEAQVALRRAAGLGGEDSEDEEDDVFQLDELNLVDQSNTDPVPRKYVQSTSGSLGVAMYDARCTRDRIRRSALHTHPAAARNCFRLLDSGVADGKADAVKTLN